MNIQSVRYFVETAKEKNISKTAKKFFVSQQAMSREIANLEKELGVTLFERNANHIFLSQAGTALLPIASAMLESYDFYNQTLLATAARNKNALQVLFENEVMISYLPYQMLGRIGDIYISTHIVQTSEQCISDVRTMTADLSMLNIPPKEMLKGLSFVELKNNPAYILVSKKHHLANKESVSILELRNEPLIEYKINTFFSKDFYTCCAQAGFYPNIKESWEHMTTAMMSVAEGEGYTIGGNFVPTPNEDKLTRVRIDDQKLRHIVGFVINPDNPRIREVESYIRAIQSL